MLQQDVGVCGIDNSPDSINDIGWYGSAYMVANRSVQLSYGRIYETFTTKWVFLVAIGLFEVGSAVCGSAPNSNTHIIGRAIAGVGAAGIMSGAMHTIFRIVPLEKRPIIGALFGAWEAWPW
ncbi:Fc.00g045490.m01.CDS01 [Cosmosporella sp. VM-42]